MRRIFIYGAHFRHNIVYPNILIILKQHLFIGISCQGEKYFLGKVGWIKIDSIKRLVRFPAWLLRTRRVRIYTRFGIIYEIRGFVLITSYKQPAS